ncbi:hypothetical protein E2C01_037467 [Portunus trituberculatus]|uniref:Uncharacterized protein n=1 Tax=Portunus trituberculatus TaxID=210409 RepID=A0A5B7FFD7_PORTR|nr:hypothetical protein [Portunus trituberculatus]
MSCQTPAHHFCRRPGRKHSGPQLYNRTQIIQQAKGILKRATVESGRGKVTGGKRDAGRFGALCCYGLLTPPWR